MEQSRRLTIRDVAQKAGVSTATVSNALNDVRGVGADVRERVLAAAKELGYRPNVAAQATRTGRTRQMAFITPDLTNPFYPRLARAVANAARAAGYALLLVDTQDGEAELDCIEQVARHDVDGILWCPATGEDVLARNRLGAPVVVIDDNHIGRDSIAANYRMSSALVAGHVAACGYRRIGMLSGPLSIFAAKLRRAEFLANLAQGEEVVWEVFHPFHQDLNEAARAAILRNEVDVIVCCDDVMAAACIQFALDHGLSVPGDVAVIGHDDMPIATLIRPKLTTVRQPLDAIGSEAVRMMIERIEEPQRANRSTAIDVELIVRESSFPGDRHPR